MPQEPETELTVLDDVDSQMVEEPTPEPTEEIPDYSIPTMAYIGPDDNIWLLETGSQTPRQITFDANRTGGDGAKVVYLSPLLSSDGTLLVYYMDVGTPSASGYDYTYGVWVANLITGEHTARYWKVVSLAWPGNPAHTCWLTGMRLIWTIPIPVMSRILPRPWGSTLLTWTAVKSIIWWRLNAGMPSLSPNWSPDGRFLAFSESVSMETGMFAYYDLENQEYVAWDESLGRASWSPDGSLLTYDRIYYVATGEERLYLRPRQGDEQLLGPDYDGPAYASQPVFSPAGDQIAYLARLDGPETDFATIMVLDLSKRRTQITRPVRGCLGVFLGPGWEPPCLQFWAVSISSYSSPSTYLMAVKLC